MSEPGDEAYEDVQVTNEGQGNEHEDEAAGGEEDEEDPPRLANLRRNPVPQIIYSPWQGDLDLSTKVGKLLWNEGIVPLEMKFSGQGKDVIRFLADVQNRIDKCFWHNITTLNGKSLIKNHGQIKLLQLKTRRDARDWEAKTAITLADARPKIDALMMYYFLYDSLGSYPQKKLSTKLKDIEQDGPMLLKVVFTDTFVATKTATFNIKEKFFELNLKTYKWNVVSLNQDVREKRANLIAAGTSSDDTDIIIALLRAYNTAANEEFKSAVAFWRNQWDADEISDAEELMQKADSKYEELWARRAWKKNMKSDQIVALTAKINAMSKSEEKSNDGTSGGKNAVPKWKYDRKLSTKSTYTRNGKTYHWCTGPGHNGKPMWTRHEPGTCTKDGEGNKTSQKRKNDEKDSGFNKTSLIAALKAKGLDDEEVESKMEAILAVMES